MALSPASTDPRRGAATKEKQTDPRSFNETGGDRGPKKTEPKDKG